MLTKKRVVVAIILAIIIFLFERVAFPQEKEKRLSPESRLELQRVVSGEFAKTKMPLPCHKKGFKIKAGEAINEAEIRDGIRDAKCSTGEAGASVQITRLEFKGKEIEVDLNDGSIKKRRGIFERLKDGSVQVGVGGVGVPMPRTETKVERPGDRKQPSEEKAQPATIILDFGRDLPDMTPDELKVHLSIILDFSVSERSAAVAWVETLPPEFQEAIRDEYVIPGMSKEVVRAAIGPPDDPIRDHGHEFSEYDVWTETWKYQYGGTMPRLYVIFDSIEPEQGKVICIKRLLPGENTQCRDSSRPNSGSLPNPNIVPAVAKPPEPITPPTEPPMELPAEEEPPPSLYPRPE